ncbi:hypothetical protein CHU95_21375 [Niveispirillum lacus]|uniref:Uncharacterized protein n=1 Tax=Niveispirillum lacus TaxID=1981099 RepID=A0A255YTD1_9PROT|nr:hypothetical protein CHU95_21375 [Niveispirillum lacus]
MGSGKPPDDDRPAPIADRPAQPFLPGSAADKMAKGEAPDPGGTDTSPGQCGCGAEGSGNIARRQDPSGARQADDPATMVTRKMADSVPPLCRLQIP